MSEAKSDESALTHLLGEKCRVVCGHCELKQYHKFEGGQRVSYGYSIEYDRHGNEVARTEPAALTAIGWDDGTPFTEEDSRELANGTYTGKRCGLLARLRRALFT